MAEFLIMARDNASDDPETDRGCYKAGDIVVAMEDGHTWGREECLPIFYVMRCPGMSLDEAAAYTQEDRGPDGGTLRRRRHRLDLDSLPIFARQAILATGAVMIPKSQAAKHLKEKAKNGDSGR